MNVKITAFTPEILILYKFSYIEQYGLRSSFVYGHLNLKLDVSK